MKSKIIADYYQSKEIVQFFKKVGGELWDELRQDVFLTICEYPEEKIINLHEAKSLKFFIVRIGLNMFRSKTSRFYYQNFKKQRLEDDSFYKHLGDQSDGFLNADRLMYKNGLFETQDETAYQKIEDRIVQLENEIENLPFFERELLKIYLELNTYKKVYLNTGIPLRTVANGVKKAINKVKTKIICNE